MTVARVKEIQVCGGRLFTMLSDACLDYIECISQGIDREKMNFSVILPDGQVKHITFRQEDDGIVVYGDFEGLPSMLDWAKNVIAAEEPGHGYVEPL